MKTLAVIFSYNRPHVLWHCVCSLFENTERVPERVVIIDDGSTDPTTEKVLMDVQARYSARSNLSVIRKDANKGFSDSAKMAFDLARGLNPKQLWLIEGDYVFAKGGLDRVDDALTNTPEGRRCFGVVGYDHPDFYRVQHRATEYPSQAVAMIGDDPVNRDILWQPFELITPRGTTWAEFASNTCFTCYLNWELISYNTINRPETWKVFDRIAHPQPIAGYPASAEFQAARVVDDGMLSNGLNLIWREMARRYGFPTDRFACWLNLKPSVANHISGGGMHAGCDELSTDAQSPSWVG